MTQKGSIKSLEQSRDQIAAVTGTKQLKVLLTSFNWFRTPSRNKSTPLLFTLVAAVVVVLLETRYLDRRQ